MRLGGMRYRLIEPLGTGGMSVVWRAFDEILERPVAVKLLAPKLLADPDSRRRIQAEARAAALLSHPHIAQVYDFGHGADGAPYVVMELVTGRSLEEVGELGAATVLQVGAQLAAALAAVHARGLVHRDVKPANVMLTDGGAKLVDFGISAVAGDLSDKGGQILGTPAYLAPERIRGLPTTAATDVYALGLLVYRALAGRFPWPEESTTTGVLEAHRRTRPAPLPPGLADPPVAAAIVRCLAKAPENRPSAAEMAEVLANATAAFSTPPAFEARSFESTRRVFVPRSKRGRVAAAGIVAAAAVGGLAMCSSGNAAADAQAKPSWMVASAPAPSAARVDCTVEYSVRSEQAGSFDADLQLKAAGGDGGWSLTFRVPDGQAIGAINGVTWHQDGDTVLLGGADMASELSAGAQFKVVGAYRDASQLPADFVLNGVACRSVLLAPAAQLVVTQVPVTQAPVQRATTAPPPPGPKPPAVNKGPGSGEKGNEGKGPKKKDD
ncbi:protein kinase [Dactylosporangium vinaceum]|uniref:non-specific serine/threonine protein kinase n=2 Tax=Dactylosporangium vinaceum TaxID=53362 RepID=A0ABV5M5D8_9ACTN|nr:protein kinase [Dactylosporangium vinaceum]